MGAWGVGSFENDDAMDWIAAHPGDPGEDLATIARRAVDAVVADSELAELWSESADHALTRTPTARLCLACGHTWFHVPRHVRR